MTAQNQRDPDGTDILGQVRDGLADLKANVISRWGRVPHVAADPTTLADGMVWVRSDNGNLSSRANGVTSPSVWTAVGLVAPWVDFGAPQQVCQYRKIGDTVYLRGMMKSGVVGTTAFTLPTGFRPPSQLYFPIISNNAFGFAIVDSTGTFNPSSGSNVFFTINCSFSTI